MISFGACNSREPISWPTISETVSSKWIFLVGVPALRVVLSFWSCQAQATVPHIWGIRLDETTKWSTHPRFRRMGRVGPPLDLLDKMPISCLCRLYKNSWCPDPCQSVRRQSFRQRILDYPFSYFHVHCRNILSIFCHDKRHLFPDLGTKHSSGAIGPNWQGSLLGRFRYKFLGLVYCKNLSWTGNSTCSSGTKCQLFGEIFVIWRSVLGRDTAEVTWKRHGPKGC